MINLSALTWRPCASSVAVPEMEGIGSEWPASAVICTWRGTAVRSRYEKIG
jgi:hypothetical protein